MVNLRIKHNKVSLKEALPIISLSVLIVLWACSLPAYPEFVLASEPVTYIDTAIKSDPSAFKDSIEMVDMTGSEAINGIEVMEIKTPVIKTEVKKTQSVTGSSLPPQRFKDAAAIACNKVADNRQDIYGEYASRNEFASKCYRAVLAMAFRESRFNCDAVGDNSKSFGCWQIQTKMHGVSIEYAKDINVMSERVADFLAVNGFPLYWHKAVAKWNGSGPMAERYAAAVYETASYYKEIGI